MKKFNGVVDITIFGEMNRDLLRKDATGIYVYCHKGWICIDFDDEGISIHAESSISVDPKCDNAVDITFRK